ncbi:hypothetical protein D3C71_2060420 [compost metagenome]
MSVMIIWKLRALQISKASRPLLAVAMPYSGRKRRSMPDNPERCAGSSSTSKISYMRFPLISL